MRGAILFDLDETLVVEEPAAVAAFEATATWRPAGTVSTHLSWRLPLVPALATCGTRRLCTATA